MSPSQEEATRVTPRECGPAPTPNLAGWLRGRVALAIRTLFLRGSKTPIFFPGKPGIRLRISVPSGVVIDVDSEHLYYSAKYGNNGEPCGPACPPDCDKHGWLDLIAGGGMGTTEFSTVPLKIEVKPVRLAESAEVDA